MTAVPITIVALFLAAGLLYRRHLRGMPRLDWPPVLQTSYRHISHRGASAVAPENTLEAFRIAVEDGRTDVLETDVHVSADGEVMVIHDPTVDRTTNGSGFVRDMTAGQIRSLDAGYRFTPDGGATFPWRNRGVRIPTLRETFQAFPHAKFNIEIKQDSPAVEDVVIRTILECNAANRVFLGSASKRILRRIKRQLREQRSSIATFNCHRAVRRFLIYHWLHLHALYRPTDYALQVMPQTRYLKVVTPGSVAFAHRAGMAVHVWTINDEDQMRALLAIGVDGIMSDYPDRLRRVLEAFDAASS